MRMIQRRRARMHTILYHTTTASGQCDLIGPGKDDLEEATIQSKVMDKVKTLQKMQSDATDEAINLASGYANVTMAKKQASMLDAPMRTGAKSAPSLCHIHNTKSGT